MDTASTAYCAKHKLHLGPFVHANAKLFRFGQEVLHHLLYFPVAVKLWILLRRGPVHSLHSPDLACLEFTQVGQCRDKLVVRSFLCRLRRNNDHSSKTILGKSYETDIQMRVFSIICGIPRFAPTNLPVDLSPISKVRCCDRAFKPSIGGLSGSL